MGHAKLGAWILRAACNLRSSVYAILPAPSFSPLPTPASSSSERRRLSRAWRAASISLLVTRLRLEVALQEAWVAEAAVEAAIDAAVEPTTAESEVSVRRFGRNSSIAAPGARLALSMAGETSGPSPQRMSEEEAHWLFEAPESR